MKTKSASQRIRDYFAKHPDAKPAEAVKALDVTPASVYMVRQKMKVESKWKEPRLCPLENEGDTTPAWGALTISTSSQPIALAAAQEPKEDMVNHPPHYKSGGIETIDFIESKGLNYRLGNVIKYVTRADHKGNRMEDLKKALWYLQREIDKG